SPDGRFLVSAGSDRTVRVWRVDTGETERVLRGHTDWIRPLLITRDGNHIVTGASDATVMVWRRPW
ncbi:MAG TPA: hypothetical protein PLG27_08980, partial [Candidatus Latescibacteria bacterium]|nr:hypothetical protein [Candidatus Latescibacterota bacterium]